MTGNDSEVAPLTNTRCSVSQVTTNPV